jgi:uncharacterized protein YqjF (DUF2071 family)
MATTLRQGLGLSSGAVASHPALQQTAHRPWPVPRWPWVGRQSWHELLFAHWPVPAAALRSYVPPGLTIQEKDGTSWVGVTCFGVSDLSLRGLPELPWAGRFLELNVRLYVEKDGKPGVWFLSLDASSALAVVGARTLLNLPYIQARMSKAPHEGGYRFESARPRGTAARFSADYQPLGGARQAAPGTLEHFLTERYCLYTRLPGGLLARVQIHHWPWPLQEAVARVEATELLAAHALPVTGPPALLHYAQRLVVIVWPPELTGRPAQGEGTRGGPQVPA